MRITKIDSKVLSSQGSAGSFGLGVPNPAPGVGSQGGDKSLSVETPVGTVPANTGAVAVKSGDKSLAGEYGSFEHTIDGTALGSASLGAPVK